MINFQQEKEEVTKNANANSTYFRPEEGENKIRIVSEPVKMWKSFDRVEKKAKVYLTEERAHADHEAKRRYGFYVLNRATGKLQIADFGQSVWTQYLNLALSSDGSFESIPPYDMVLVKTGTGLDTEYVLRAARGNSELTSEERAMIAEAEPLLAIITKDAEESKIIVDSVPF